MVHSALTEVTFYINNGVQLILAAYFAKKYLDTEVKACTAWSAGFLSYAISGIFFEMIKKDIFAYTTANIFLRATLIAAGIVLFYYGVSLLFFEGGFIRQKGITLALFFIMLLVNTYYAYASEDVVSYVKTLNIIYTYLFIFPLFTVISILFYQIYRRLPAVDPRRRNMLLLSLAWLGLAVFNMLYPLTYAASYHWITRTGTTASRLLLLYGMIYAEI
jgi:hypothetical protein